MTPTNAAQLSARLQTVEEAELRQQLADAEAAEQRDRALYPDAQTWTHPLDPPLTEHDPPPQVQQAYADDYRRAHPEAIEHRQLGTIVISDVADALHAWRIEEARKAWSSEAEKLIKTPCAVCATVVPSAGSSITIGRASVSVCARCRPSVIAAISSHVAAEQISDNGLTRQQKAAALVDSIMEASQ
jgi:hypothetical protein